MKISDFREVDLRQEKIAEFDDFPDQKSQNPHKCKSGL